jgi:hypothetical protein
MNNLLKVKIKICKKLLSNFFLNTTAHGFSHAVSTKYKLIRLLWTVFIVASVSSCCYFIIKQILQYLEYGVTTKVSILQEIPAYFPLVTICNANPFTTKSAKDFVDKVFAENNMTSVSDLQFFDDYQLKTTFSYYLAITSANLYETTNAERRTFGASEEEFILSCNFNVKPCGKNVQWLYHPFFGNCYQFNTKRTEKSSKPDNIYGLTLSLFTGAEVDVETSKQQGAIIIITDQNTNTATVSGNLRFQKQF